MYIIKKNHVYFVMCHVLHFMRLPLRLSSHEPSSPPVRCQMSDVKCQMSDVRCQTSYDRYQIPDIYQTRCGWADLQTALILIKSVIQLVSQTFFSFPLLFCEVAQLSNRITSQYLIRPVRDRELKLGQKVHLRQPVTCHVSHDTCHVSHVTCHESLCFFVVEKVVKSSSQILGILLFRQCYTHKKRKEKSINNVNIFGFSGP